MTLLCLSAADRPSKWGYTLCYWACSNARTPQIVLNKEISCDYMTGYLIGLMTWKLQKSYFFQRKTQWSSPTASEIGLEVKRPEPRQQPQLSTNSCVLASIRYKTQVSLNSIQRIQLQTTASLITDDSNSEANFAEWGVECKIEHISTQNKTLAVCSLQVVLLESTLL